MKRYGNLWQPLVSFENIFLAFTKATRGKGYKPYVLEFMQNFEHNLLALQEALITKTYQPGDYTAFFIYEPKNNKLGVFVSPSIICRIESVKTANKLNVNDCSVKI